MSGTKLCFVGKCHELHTQYKKAHLGTALKSNPFSVKSNLSSVRSKHWCYTTVVACQYIKGAYRKERERLFTRACTDSTRGNGLN
uniref:Uncharacterized protein n=1 Tax=Buteo japonicus TaxID=224669 RepID=A0A8C0BIA3_9AVES